MSDGDVLDALYDSMFPLPQQSQQARRNQSQQRDILDGMFSGVSPGDIDPRLRVTDERPSNQQGGDALDVIFAPFSPGEIHPPEQGIFESIYASLMGLINMEENSDKDVLDKVFAPLDHGDITPRRKPRGFFDAIYEITDTACYYPNATMTTTTRY